MTVEVSEVVKFFERVAPFGSLTREERSALSRSVEIRYARSGSAILSAGDHNERLFIVRSGAVELRLAGQELTAQLSEGAAFAYPSLLRGGEVFNSVFAMEDTLLYTIPGASFHQLRKSNQAFRQFFAKDEATRISHALAKRRQSTSFQLESMTASDLIGRAQPISCGPETSIQDAVHLMDKRDVSTLAVCTDGALVGIFTDKDLRKRVVAARHDLSAPIRNVMTASPRSLPSTSSAAEAMALMASGGFRHIPLMDESGALSGILSATDILSAIGNNAIDTGMIIARAQNAKDLIKAAILVPESFSAMALSGMHAMQVMQLTSAMGEAVHRKAAQIAEQELGKAPCPYAFVVFGSLARREQLVGSDQDNGLIISDEANEDDLDYFAELGARISDLLDACGFVYCSGGIMAKNDQQRGRLAHWCDRYKRWITEPDEDKILRATIFFDMRHVHGDASLVNHLRTETLRMVQDSSIFVSYLARDALRSKIPLGFFRNLVLETSADGEKTFNAKGQAIMPIVDIARAHALAAGLPEVGTIERFKALVAAGKINSDDAQSLEDAMLLVNEMRIAHQAEQLRVGKSPDNLIAPHDLSTLERDYLKDAFAVIRQNLDSLRRNFAGGIA